MHDIKLSTMIALPEILNYLKKKEAHFVKLDECIEIIEGMEMTSLSFWRKYIDNHMKIEENDSQKKEVAPLHDIQSTMISLPMILDAYFKKYRG